MKNLISCHKQLKIIMDSTKSIEFKVDAGLNLNIAINNLAGKGNADEKVKMDKTFQAKSIGRPKGELHENKSNT